MNLSWVTLGSLLDCSWTLLESYWSDLGTLFRLLMREPERVHDRVPLSGGSRIPFGLLLGPLGKLLELCWNPF